VIRSDNRPRKRGRRDHTMEFGIIVMWSMHRGWSNTKTARFIGVTRGTVSSQRFFFYDHPGEIFRYPILRSLNGISGRKGLWKCEVCDSNISGTKATARKHVALHIFNEDTIRLYGLESES